MWDKELEAELNPLTYKIRGCLFNVYNELGPGLLESVYEEALCYELQEQGLTVRRQVDVPIHYYGEILKTTLRLDVIVNDSVIIEIKSVSKLEDIHFKQILTYLKLTDTPLGLLMNFNTSDFATGIKRVILNKKFAI